MIWKEGISERDGEFREGHPFSARLLSTETTLMFHECLYLSRGICSCAPLLLP